MDLPRGQLASWSYHNELASHTPIEKHKHAVASRIQAFLLTVAGMAGSSTEIDVFFVGLTGVGKSSLINMIIGAESASVSNNTRPCTTQTTCYSATLETGLQCQLWDTRGLGEAADTHDRTWMSRVMDRIRQLASQQAQELRDTLRRTRLGTRTPILVWCMDASKIGVLSHWQQFGKVYVEYCDRRATPVVVINQMSPDTTDWEQKCRGQLQKLKPDEGPNVADVFLLRVRRYRKMPYDEDSRALKDLVSRLAGG